MQEAQACQGQAIREKATIINNLASARPFLQTDGMAAKKTASHACRCLYDMGETFGACIRSAWKIE